MKQSIALVFMCSAFAAHLMADTATVDGITWEYTFIGISGNASVGGGSSNSPAVSTSTTGAINIPSTLSDYPVTSIGDYAFYNCRSLMSVTIPDSITSIGSHAFDNCRSLTSVTIPDSVTSIGARAFYGCTNLFDTNSIPQVRLVDGWVVGYETALSGASDLTGVRGIGSYAFSDCSGLTSVTIPDSVTSIGSYAFKGCSGLTSVTIPDSVTSIGAYAFYGCTNLFDTNSIPQVRLVDGWVVGYETALSGALDLTGVRGIGSYAFSGCSGLTSVTIPDSVTSIGDWVFNNCRSLTSVTIPYPVTSIGDNAFYNCRSLMSVTIPDSITSIGSCAFYDCRSLTSVTIPDSVTSIGTDAFYGCTNLFDTNSIPQVRLVDGWVVGYETALSGALDLTGVRGIGKKAFAYCNNLTSVTIPDSVTRIGDNAFYNCRSLTSVTIPDSVTSIDSWAFSNCRGLTSVAIPNGVTRIGYRAFSNCSSLMSVTIPDSMTSIGSYAFYGCSALTSVIIPRDCVVASSAFPPSTVICRPTQILSLDAAGGTVSPESLDVAYGTEYGELPIPMRTGYTFQGWKYGGVILQSNTVVSVRDHHTAVAQWQVNQYAVAFNANGGNGGWSMNMDYGTTIVAPTVSREGYTFMGWSPAVADTVPTHDLAYTAQWRINQYAVAFDANGGEGGTSTIQDYGAEITEPTVTRTGYTFTGWVPEVAATVPASNVTYTAQWQINQYAVAFDANGGEGGVTNTLDYGAEIVAPDVTRTGYSFTGWAPKVAATVPASNVTYTAQWDANTYAVTFNPNGGNLDGATEKPIVFDAAYGELPTPSLEFCDFLGWTLDGEVVSATTTVATDADHELVASWRRWGARVGESEAGQPLRELYPDDYAHITDVVLEEGLREIPAGFFDGCGGIVRLTLPDSLVTLGASDLPPTIRLSLDYGAYGFMVYGGWVLGYIDEWASSLTLPAGTVGVGTRALACFWDLETVEMPGTVRRIGREAFQECTFLDNVVLPDSVETIAEGAFDNCSYMQTLSVGGGVRGIAARAFARCASLQAVAFADGLECVGECAFSNDWRMLSVSLPHSVTNIGEGAFARCRGITGVAVPANVMTLAGMFPAAYGNIESCVVAAGEADIMAGMFEGCAALSDFTWSGSETNVGARAFRGCASLTAVAMPDSVERIGAEAFAGCSSLRDLTLSRSLAALPDGAFESCVSLDSFIVPASVSSLGSGFIYQSGVSAVYFLGNAPAYDGGAYAGVDAGLVTYVVRGTRGWDGTPSSRVLPEDWLGHDITYWTPNRFDATFDANGGYFGESSVTQWAEEQITDMGYALPNENPVRPGYAFDGWWTEPTAGAQVRYSTQVTATRPHTLYAHWRLLGEQIVAAFNANGGTAVIPGSQSYFVGQTFGELPVASRRGYAFLGWWTEAAGGTRMTESSAVPAADIELFAHWEPVSYFVAFDANGGSGAMANQTLVYDDAAALFANVFTLAGHAFSGWARSADGQVEFADRASVVNLAETSGAVVTLYAVWSVAGYNVRFDSNGGTGRMDSQTIAIGETQNLHTNAFVYSGRVFAGWATTPGGAAAYRDGEAVCGLADTNGATVNLYAVWRSPDATCRVAFDANGGSVSPVHWNVAVGENLDALPTPTRPGHAFAGWWTRSVGGTAVTAPVAVSSAMTLYAHWRENGDPLPVVSGDAGVAAVLGDSADMKLAENIKTVDEYNALVEWADEKGISHQAVRESGHVWTAYALGADALFENEPAIRIASFELANAQGTGNGEQGTAVAMTVTVEVKDGEDVVKVAEEKVAAMFEATSDLRDWTGAAKLTPTVSGATRNADNTMTFTVTPGNGTAKSAFLRVKVK